LELRSRETALGPAIGPVIITEESVLLFQTEPGFPVLVGLHELGAFVAVVVLIGRAIVVPALSEDKDVGRAKEGIGEDGDRLQVDIGVFTRGLTGRGTVEVPGGEVRGGVFLSRERLQRMVLVKAGLQRIKKSKIC